MPVLSRSSFRLADQLEDAARNLQRTADELRELLAPPSGSGESQEGNPVTPRPDFQDELPPPSGQSVAGKGLDDDLEENPPLPLPKLPPPPPGYA